MSGTWDEAAGVRHDFDSIIGLVGKLTAREREQLFEKLRIWYCFNCGNEQPESERRCQCANDE